MNSQSSFRIPALSGSVLALLGTAILPSTAFAEGDNWVEMEVGGVASGGNDAAYSRRHANNGEFYGGVRDFHFEQLFDNGMFEADGHLMFGLEDYEVDLKYTQDDLGFVRAGFKQFRTWYDGSGGYIPGAAPAPNWLGGTAWGPGGQDPISPYDDELTLDRGAIWFEAGLRMPDFPDITFFYEHSWRSGNKDSTFWFVGDQGVNAYPGIYNIDEVRDIFKLDVDHTIGNTDFGGGLRYHSVRNNDSRAVRYYDGRFTRQSYMVNQQDINEYDLWGGHLYSTSRFNDDKVMLSFGYNLTTIDSDIGGYRTNSHAYNNLMGGGQSTTSVLNASLWWNPIEDLVIVPSFRYEWWYQDMWGSHISGADMIVDRSDYESNEATAEVEVRYSGIDSALLYARAMYSARSGDMFRSTNSTSADLGDSGSRYTDSDTDIQKYVVGANWYPMSGVSVATQAYYKVYDQNFNHSLNFVGPGTGDDALMVGHRTETADFNARVTWRPLPGLSFVTRYDYQQIDIEGAEFVNPVMTETADITKHIITESVSWSPLDRLYMTLGVHWISSETDTPADLYVPGSIQDWDNDYWSLTFNGGYAISEDTQLNWSYYYYQADNYTATAMPYGFDGEEHMFTVGIDQRLTENMAINVRYGYFKGDDSGAGGFNDYDAHVISTGLRMRF